MSEFKPVKREIRNDDGIAKHTFQCIGCFDWFKESEELILNGQAGYCAFCFNREAKARKSIDPCDRQQTPHGTGPDIANLVCADIEARAKMGEKKYGERLKAHNGRDAEMDLYQELLDACMYVRQLLEERKSSKLVHKAMFDQVVKERDEFKAQLEEAKSVLTMEKTRSEMIQTMAKVIEADLKLVTKERDITREALEAAQLSEQAIRVEMNNQNREMETLRSIVCT